MLKGEVAKWQEVWTWQKLLGKTSQCILTRIKDPRLMSYSGWGLRRMHSRRNTVPTGYILVAKGPWVFLEVRLLFHTDLGGHMIKGFTCERQRDKAMTLGSLAWGYRSFLIGKTDLDLFLQRSSQQCWGGKLQMEASEKWPKQEKQGRSGQPS